MINKFYKFLIIIFSLVLISCEEQKKEEAEIEQKKGIPTNEKVEYVFACMQANAETPEYLNKCSCSIDYVESVMDYDDYVQAETIMSLRQIYGEKSLMFKATPNAKEIYTQLQNVLAEAEMECF